jgi:hypothetical protein
MRYPATAAAGEDKAEALMQLVLDQHFASGEHLLHAPDDQFWFYDGKMWAVLPKSIPPATAAAGGA